MTAPPPMMASMPARTRVGICIQLIRTPEAATTSSCWQIMTLGQANSSRQPFGYGQARAFGERFECQRHEVLGVEYLRIGNVERPFPALETKEIIDDLVGVVTHDVCTRSRQVG